MTLYADSGIPPAVLSADYTYVPLRVMVDPLWAAEYLNENTGASWGAHVGYSDASTVFWAAGWEGDESGLEDSAAPNYGSTDIPGRAESYQTYAGTANRQFSLTFVFKAETTGESPATAALYAEQDSGQPGVMYNHWDVLFWPRWFEAFTRPVYSPVRKLSLGTAPCIVNIGKTMAARCNISGVTCRFNGPFQPGTLLPHGSSASVEFIVARAEAGADYDNYVFDGTPNYCKFLVLPGG